MIKGIYLDGVWCDVPDQIKKAVVDHFSSRFKECNLNKPCFNSPLFRNISSSDASYLESNISLNEIKAAVWDYDGSKVPGCNPSFVALIPKKADPLGFSDYRPISLIGCVYKVISKIIVASCLVANELICMAKIENQNLMIFKVDFVKDFDTSISILVNGSPSAEFKMERGIRQGDPLSSFLFFLVAEALQMATLEACNMGFFNGLKINLSKSRIFGIGIPDVEVEEIASSLGCLLIGS
ncbi:hypothetical protein Tco_1026531 [Tanacetum coccineum]